MGINKHTVELTQKILEAACRGESPIDLENLSATTLRSLSLITAGDPIEFTDRQQPPVEVLSWLYEADLVGAHGLLFETLYRWHELRHDRRREITT